ncbi:stalk domain-containing protein [Paenibacillus sp. SYP-B4298]|uniref:stalk domain-containing protein n=1 Tax=Paenibacillus sp. SYP-B4298 TaxID=2996034 RepID=UPI0022DE063C|nr:stalk domain-containing protein [Paenibacillus sp. SYP-B4298]
MKKSIVTLALGIFIGVAASYAGPAVAAVKQFILNEVNYPVVVDGVTYKDSKNPILNYNGSTYIPLAKIGDLTGVQYKWNAGKKQVEISTGAKTTSSTDGPAGRKNDYLKPNTEVIIEEPKIKGYNGVSDEADVNYHVAADFGREMPPLLSEGWVAEDLIFDVFNLGYFPDTEAKDGKTYDVIKIRRNYTTLITITLPDGWSDKEAQKEVVADGIRIQRHMNTNYFSISDLEKQLGIKS